MKKNTAVPPQSLIVSMLRSEMERMEAPNIGPCQCLLTLKLNTEEKHRQTLCVQIKLKCQPECLPHCVFDTDWKWGGEWQVDDKIIRVLLLIYFLSDVEQKSKMSLLADQVAQDRNEDRKLDSVVKKWRTMCTKKTPITSTNCIFFKYQVDDHSAVWLKSFLMSNLVASSLVCRTLGLSAGLL